MNDFWHVVIRHLEHHVAFYSASASALFVAGVCTMPSALPRTLQEWWTWIREALQTAIPAARHPQNPQNQNPNKEK